MAPTSRLPAFARSTGLRLWRLGLLALAVATLRESPHPVPIALDRVRDFFPAAASIASDGDPQLVRDSSGVVIGSVMQTLPEANDIIGYAGPTNTLIALDARGYVLGLRVLHSDDTPDHVAEIIGTREFFRRFKGLRAGHLDPRTLDAVSGATLTSSAITEGVLRKLGRQGPSLRFPERISLAEVQTLEPRAAALREHGDAQLVLDAKGAIIAQVLRTAPASDSVIGYKGPTDTLLLLDPAGQTVRGVQLRKSFDTARYVGYVTGDSQFMNLFKGMSVEALADFDAERFEGVSGASDTSRAVAKGMKLRAQSFAEQRQPLASFLKALHWRWQDTGHVLVLLSALIMAFTKLRGETLARTVHHLLLFGYVGLIAGELLSQALFAGWARHGVPWRVAPGLVLTGVVALLAPVVTRRQLYCHHICPHGAAQQLLMKNVRWQFTPPAWLERLPFVLLGLVFMCVALGITVNLNSVEPFDAYVWKIAGVASLSLAVLGLVASVFVPMGYCRYGCPTGALFKLLRYAGDQDTFGRRDWICASVVALSAGWRWCHGW